MLCLVSAASLRQLSAHQTMHCSGNHSTGAFINHLPAPVCDSVCAAFYLYGQRFIVMGERVLKHHSSQHLSWCRVISHKVLKVLLWLKTTHWERDKHAHTDRKIITFVMAWYSSHVRLFSCLSHCPTLVLATVADRQEVGWDAVGILNCAANIINKYSSLLNTPTYMLFGDRC